MSLLLLPIIAFIAAYTTIAYSYATDTEVPFKADLKPVIGAMAVIWVASFILFFKKIKSIRNDQGLGVKLQKYFNLTIVRYAIALVISLALVILFFLTKDDRLTGLFAANMALSILLWPVSSKICRDLKLRGDEREMVYYKKDTF